MVWLNSFFIILLISLFSRSVIAPPPNRQKTEETVSTKPQEDEIQKIYNFPYSKYLELVVKILEAQPVFQNKIQKMSEDEVKSGKIADFIGDLDPKIFEKLTKIKLEEIKRLEAELKNLNKTESDNINLQILDHLDFNNPEKFDKEDLRKLIKTAVADMTRIDEERKKEFKEYEMKKKAEEDHRLAQLSEAERQKAIEKNEEVKKRHNDHQKINHPGGIDQIEEVWEERDHMSKDSYDPKAFFALHDLNGDGFWNNNEVEALFQLELEKMYNESNSDDDSKEKLEEMYRMREHVVEQIDKNKDGLISRDEFLMDPEAQQSNTNTNEEWNDLSKKKIYTDEELEKYKEKYAKEQNWGEHPYDPLQTLPPPITPVMQHTMQQPAQQPIQPIVNSLPDQKKFNQDQQANMHQEKIVKQIDPVYGV